MTQTNQGLEARKQNSGDAPSVAPKRRDVLLVVEDSTDSRVVQGFLHASLPEIGVARVWTGFQALTAVQRRPSEFCLIVLDLPASSDTLDLIRRIQDLAPAAPMILMNNRGLGALLVPRRAKTRTGHALSDEAVAGVWHRLRGHASPAWARVAVDP